MSLVTLFLKFNKLSGYTKAIVPEEDAEFFVKELGFKRLIDDALKSEQIYEKPKPIKDDRPIEVKLKDPDVGWGEPGSELWNLRHLESLRAKRKVIEFIKEVTHFTISLDNKTLPIIKAEAAKLLKAHHERDSS